MDYEGIFKKYVELFESTFRIVLEPEEPIQDTVTLGLCNENPYGVAHTAGAALVNLRVPSGYLPEQKVGEPLNGKVCLPPKAILFWRDRPIWDSFPVCRRCGCVHPDGIDPWIKETVNHKWEPVKMYSLYMRFRIDLDK